MSEELDYFLERLERRLRAASSMKPDMRIVADCVLSAKRDLQKKLEQDEARDNALYQEHMADTYRYGSGD